MFRIVDRETEQVITCEPDAECPNNCIIVLPSSVDFSSLVPIPPFGYEWLYDAYGNPVYDINGERVYTLIPS